MTKFLAYRWFGLALLLIILLFFALRLPNLTLQPIFADEAIYIRWAQIMKAEPSLRFVSMTDGKTPLYMWILMPVFKFIEDPLLAGRVLSVFSGFATLIGVFLIGFIFFNKRTALIASFLIAITPFIVFFDRMALVDSMLAAATIWVILFLLLLERYQRLDIAMILGYFLGAGTLIKTPGLLNIYLLPLGLISTLFLKKKNLFKNLLLLAVAGVIGLVMYNLLRLGPGFSNLSARDQDYIFTVSEVLSHPWNPLFGNLFYTSQYFLGYLGFPLIIALLLGIGFSLWRRNINALLILAWGLGTILIAASLIKPYTARYILLGIPPLLLITAYGLDQLLSLKSFRNIPLQIGTLLVISLWPAYFLFSLLTAPEKAPLPQRDFSGYFEEWTAGVGLREIATYLEDKSNNGKVVVGTEGIFGTLPDGLVIYFDGNPNVVFQGDKGFITQGLKTAAKDGHQTFFVANRTRFQPARTDNLELIAEYKRVNDKDAIMFYQVLPGDKVLESTSEAIIR